ncbi:hypothetical protein N9N67_01850 [Bacteriovoracaceae bacterium]|nr:hypothetical protein [Bacteriovoracaceae bacterium]
MGKLLEHKYGDQFHILNNAWANHLLALFSSDKTQVPNLFLQVDQLYQYMLQYVLNNMLEKKQLELKTRMYDSTDKAVLNVEGLDLSRELSILSLARAGIIPSQRLFESLLNLYPVSQLRMDHVYINRKTNEQNEVVGVEFTGSKIGGSFQNKTCLIPDPMGATGSTIDFVVNNLLKENSKELPKRVIAMHLIITPEYIKLIKEKCPQLQVVALRVDRGLTEDKYLSDLPGTFLEEEKGLNQFHYIVPGAGGVGELFNNSFC